MSWGWNITCCCNVGQYYYYAPKGVVYGPETCVTVFPTTTTNKGIGGGALSWTNVARAEALDGSTTTIPNPTAIPGAQPDTIVATGFAFSIPSNALITSMQALIYAETFGATTIKEFGFIPKITFAGNDYFPGDSGGIWTLGSFGPEGSLVMTTGLPPVADINAGGNAEYAFNTVSGSGSGGLSLDAVSIKICYKVPI